MWGDETLMFYVPKINIWPGQPQSYETVLIRIKTILSPAVIGRKPLWENHQALAVKSERHPMCDTKWNQRTYKRAKLQEMTVEQSVAY